MEEAEEKSNWTIHREAQVPTLGAQKTKKIIFFYRNQTHIRHITQVCKFLLSGAWGGRGWLDGERALCSARLMLLVKLVSSAEQTSTKTTLVESVAYSSQPVERKFPKQLWSRWWGHQWADFFFFLFKNQAMGLINCCCRDFITDSSSSRPPPERCVLQVQCWACMRIYILASILALHQRAWPPNFLALSPSLSDKLALPLLWNPCRPWPPLLRDAWDKRSTIFIHALSALICVNHPFTFHCAQS